MNYESRVKVATSPPTPPRPSGGWSKTGRGRIVVFIIFIFGVAVGYYLKNHLEMQPASAKIITLKSRNLDFKAETYDREINHGITIDISKPVKVLLVDGGNEREVETSAETIDDLLFEQNIGLADTDQVSFTSSPQPSPPRGGEGERVRGNQFLAEGMIIIIDRIVDLEVTEDAEIPYEIKLVHDPHLFYGREEVESAGKLGKKEQDFLITYKNGVEVKRKLLRERVLQKPVTEIRNFGIKIEIEEAREGRASWYAFKKCLCAAHPFYDFGRYARITAINSGKSIIVRINDRGPVLEVHPDRIIDLDSVAYKELAPLGSGTIAVRVELLKN